MKVPLRFPALILSIVLCPFVCSPVSAQASAPPAPTSNPTQEKASQAIPQPSPSSSVSEVTIPGPLRSFLRMAAISQKVSKEEVLPLLAHNVMLQGFDQYSTTKIGKDTEYLTLLKRYLQQARELQTIAGSDGIIRVSNCDDAKPLLRSLGYHLRQDCGKDTSVETSDPDRAFLTIDSGFPLVDLEETLRGGKPFTYAYPSATVPVLFRPSDWTNYATSPHKSTNVIDALVSDPFLARLYWALSRIDTDTANEMREEQGIEKLLPLASVLDFYGTHITIQSGRVVVPGGEPAESAWKSLAGANPSSPREFIPALLTKDQGWLAVYFDALSRVNQSQQAYFTDSRHIHRMYQALLDQGPAPSPARPAFRPDAGLLLLMSRLDVDSAGRPDVPGGLEVWGEILRRKTDSKVIRDWGKRSANWKDPDELVEAMVALSRVPTVDGPLQLYLKLNEIDRGRAPEQRLKPDTVRLLSAKFQRFGDQYIAFSEFQGLNDTSIVHFLNVADSLDHVSNRALRANALGIFQANVGLWEIFARQGQISGAGLNDSWEKVIKPFAGLTSSAQLFDAGQSSVTELVRAVTGSPEFSEDRIIVLLAAPPQTSSDGTMMQQELANKMRSVMEDQRLVSLDTLFTLGDGLNKMAKGEGKPDKEMLARTVGEIREFEMPRAIFTSSEKTEWSSGQVDNSHIALQARTDLLKVIQTPGSPEMMAEARGELSPFLRDTLVGLNYAYFEPPGGQMLHVNPLFVRSHDFSGQMTSGGEQSWRAPDLFGRGEAASGGAHLAGSLADLPYVLAKAEESFLVPENVQALIWEEMVPSLLTSATVPRWWDITHNELHAVTLYQRTGEELLRSAATDEKQRQRVMLILSDRMLPQRSEQLAKALQAGQIEQILPQITPSETSYLAAEFRRRFPNETTDWGAAGTELDSLSHCCADDVSWQRVSKDFGVPHPALAQSYADNLVNVKPFPAVMGYSSRLLAETWESSNLYWARLADEMGYSPVMLNRVVPELTHRMIEKIFATTLEDWPAVLRAMQETGDEFRRGEIASLPKVNAAPAP
jgi:hypothetical protein